MQFLNNDMDELMRRAAEGYEPQVTGSDWEAVQKELAETKSAASGIWWNSGLRFGLVFAFLLASLVCNRYLHLSLSNPSYLNQRAALLEQDVAIKEVSEKENKKISTDNSDIKREALISTKNVSKPFYNQNIDTKSIASKELVNDANKLKVKKYIYKDVNQFDDRMWQHSSKYSKRLNLNFQLQQPLLKNSSIVIMEREERLVQKSGIKNRGLYVGAMAGLDGSTVKFNEVKIGFSGGVLAGYKINKKWSVETGLIWSKKSYYAEGKDFNPNKVYLPSHSNILHADGYCQMFEIPIQLQYHFAEDKRHNWFASAGASSYIMQKEEYDYLYERYNVQYYSTKYYKTSSRHLLATLNISAGYQYKAGKASLRVEPYVKLPVGKMGVGQLPITSAGLQIGLIYPLR